MATYTTTSAPLPWMEPYLRDYMARAQEVANTPFEQSPGTYTGPNDLLQSGFQMTANRAMRGSPEMSAARGQLTNTINGQFLGRQATQNASARAMNPYMNAGNPYAGQMNPYAGVQNNAANAANPYAGQMNPYAGVRNEAANVANPYASMNNPYLQQSINDAQGDLVRSYNLVNKPAWDKAMQQSGSFGNSGVAEMAQNERNDLMKNLGRIGNDMRMSAYGLGANLAESQAGRQFQAGNQLQQNLYGAGQQQNQNLFNAGESLAGRQFSAGSQLQQNLYGAGNQQAQNLYNTGQQQMQNQFNAGNQFAQNQYNAGQDYAGRQDAMGNLERGYQQSAMGLAPTFANQDYTDLNNLMNAGGLQQQFNQAYQNQQQQFFNERRQYPMQMTQFYGAALGQGNPGQTQTQQAPDPSTASQVLGGALTGAGIYNLLTR